MTCDMRYSFLFLWQEINFLWQETFFLSQENFLLWQILYSFCQKMYSSCHGKFFLWHGYISFDGKCSSYYKEYCVHHMKYIFCHRNDYSLYFVTRNIFPVRQINNFFPVTQGVFLVTGFVPILAINIHPMSLCMCSNSIFPVTRTFFLVT